MFSKISELMIEIENEISSSNSFISTQKILEITTKKLESGSEGTLSILAYLIFFLWCGAVIDAFFSKKRETLNDPKTESLKRIQYFQNQLKDKEK